MTGMEPLVMAQVAGAALSAVGAISQASAARGAADYNAKVAASNAITARQQGEADAARQERESRLRAGAARARVGAAGIDVGGSPLAVLEDNAMQEKLDELRILHASEVQAIGFENEAMLEKSRGAAAMRSGVVSAVGQLGLAGATAYSAGGFGGDGSSFSKKAGRLFSGGSPNESLIRMG